MNHSPFLQYDKPTNLWLDLGNTRLKYWLTDESGKVLEHDAKQHLQAPAEVLWGLTDRFFWFNPSFIGISSVLGADVNEKVAKTLQRLEIPFQFAKVSCQHELMKSQYDPNQLGVDRWLQMLGAVDFQQKLCVIGCGTALTIDLIDKGEHLGGYIFPNLYLQRNALLAGTRQISIHDGLFDSLDVGTTTKDAVNRGILLSVVGAIGQIIKQNPDFEIVMTGGDAMTLSPFLDKSPMILQDLLLIGLQRFFAKMV